MNEKIKIMCEEIYTQACEVLKKEKKIDPTFFMVTKLEEEKPHVDPFMIPGFTSDALYAAVNELLKEDKPEYLIHITPAYVLEMEDTDQDSAILASEHPDRKEALLLIGMSPAGEMISMMGNIEKDKGNIEVKDQKWLDDKDVPIHTSLEKWC